MRKIPFVLVMVIIASIITTTNKAQLLTANAVSIKKSPDYDKGASKSSKEEARTAKAAVKLSKANIKATKNFNENYQGGQKVMWYNGATLISASFTENEINTTVFYTKNGNWLRTMKVYDEDKLQKEIRKLVKRSEYYDYKITHIQEFKEGEITFYVVHLEDARTFKQIVVHDGQINLISDYSKP